MSFFPGKSNGTKAKANLTLPEYYCTSSISDIDSFIRSNNPMVIVFIRGHKNASSIKHSEGNSSYRKMIQEHMKEYGLIDKKKRKPKTVFTQTITHQLVQDGFRFVVWDTKRGEFFEYNMSNEKGFNEVRNKVRQSLKDGWKKLENDALYDNCSLNDDLLGSLDEEQILQVLDPNVEIMKDIFDRRRERE